MVSQTLYGSVDPPYHGDVQMKQLDVDDSVQPAFLVRLDAEAQHTKYWPTFSKTKQDHALKLKQLVVDAYTRSKVYLNARDQFIVVKVDRPSLKDKLGNDAAFNSLNVFVIAADVEVVATKNNLLFRIPR